MYFKALFPAFLMAFGFWRFYLGFGFLLLLMPICWIKYPRMRGVIIIFVAYLILYSGHWRSYYFTRSLEASIWDTVRYALNILPLFAIVAGACFFTALSGINIGKLHIRGIIGRIVVLLALLLMASNIWISLNLRSELLGEERIGRVLPVRRAIDLMQNLNDSEYWVFTYTPCLFQLYGSPDLNIVDISGINRYSEIADEIVRNDRAYACLTPFDRSEQVRTRFPMQSAWLDSNSAETLNQTDEMIIIRLELEEKGN
jgi:hypothetical protein